MQPKSSGFCRLAIHRPKLLGWDHLGYPKGCLELSPLDLGIADTGGWGEGWDRVIAVIARDRRDRKTGARKPLSPQIYAEKREIRKAKS